MTATDAAAGQRRVAGRGADTAVRPVGRPVPDPHPDPGGRPRDLHALRHPRQRRQWPQLVEQLVTCPTIPTCLLGQLSVVPAGSLTRAGRVIRVVSNRRPRGGPRDHRATAQRTRLGPLAALAGHAPHLRGRVARPPVERRAEPTSRRAHVHLWLHGPSHCSSGHDQIAWRQPWRSGPHSVLRRTSSDPSSGEASVLTHRGLTHLARHPAPCHRVACAGGGHAVPRIPLV